MAGVPSNSHVSTKCEDSAEKDSENDSGVPSLINRNSSSDSLQQLIDKELALRNILSNTINPSNVSENKQVEIVVESDADEAKVEKSSIVEENEEKDVGSPNLRESLVADPSVPVFAQANPLSEFTGGTVTYEQFQSTYDEVDEYLEQQNILVSKDVVGTYLKIEEHAVVGDDVAGGSCEEADDEKGEEVKPCLVADKSESKSGFNITSTLASEKTDIEGFKSITVPENVEPCLEVDENGSNSGIDITTVLASNKDTLDCIKGIQNVEHKSTLEDEEKTNIEGSIIISENVEQCLEVDENESNSYITTVLASNKDTLDFIKDIQNVENKSTLEDEKKSNEGYKWTITSEKCLEANESESCSGIDITSILESNKDTLDCINHLQNMENKATVEEKPIAEDFESVFISEDVSPDTIEPLETTEDPLCTTDVIEIHPDGSFTLTAPTVSQCQQTNYELKTVDAEIIDKTTKDQSCSSSAKSAEKILILISTHTDKDGTVAENPIVETNVPDIETVANPQETSELIIALEQKIPSENISTPDNSDNASMVEDVGKAVEKLANDSMSAENFDRDASPVNEQPTSVSSGSVSDDGKSREFQMDEDEKVLYGLDESVVSFHSANQYDETVSFHTAEQDDENISLQSIEQMDVNISFQSAETKEKNVSLQSIEQVNASISFQSAEPNEENVSLQNMEPMDVNISFQSAETNEKNVSLQSIEQVNASISFQSAEPNEENVSLQSIEQVNASISFQSAEPNEENVSLQNIEPMDVNISFQSAETNEKNVSLQSIEQVNASISFQSAEPNEENVSLQNIEPMDVNIPFQSAETNEKNVSLQSIEQVNASISFQSAEPNEENVSLQSIEQVNQSVEKYDVDDLLQNIEQVDAISFQSAELGSDEFAKQDICIKDTAVGNNFEKLVHVEAEVRPIDVSSKQDSTNESNSAEKKSVKKKKSTSEESITTSKVKKTKKTKKSEEKENISVVASCEEIQYPEIHNVSDDSDDLSNVCVRELKLTYCNEATKTGSGKTVSTEEPVPASVPIKELRRSFGDLRGESSETDVRATDLAASYENLISELNAPPTLMDNKRSSFGKFDQLTKKTLLHVRSSDASKAQQHFQNDGQDNTCLCKACNKNVFAMEQIKAERHVWHKNCFRCKTCNKQLTVDIYSSHEGELYCKPHFKDLFKPKVIVEEEKPLKLKKPELIIRENQPIDLPPDVVRASDKPDLGLEELSNLNVKSRFQVFEKQQEEDASDKSPVLVKRSPSILSKLAKFQSKGMDVGVPKDIFHGIEFVETSSSDEEQAPNVRITKEKPIAFNKMDDVKKTWENGQTARREERREERRQELQHIRSRLFMGKQNKMREAYENAVAESEKGNVKRDVEVKSDKARFIKEQFERGNVLPEDSDEEQNKKQKPKDDDADVFEAGISKKSRSIFQQIDAAVVKTQSSNNISSTPPSSNGVKKHKEVLNRQVSSDIVRASDPVEEISVETADVSSKFKFFETYKAPEVTKKTFRITPPREGQLKTISPEKEVPKKVEEVVNDEDTLVKSQTTAKMLSLFRQLEEAHETVPDGPKPLKKFTPPPASSSSSEDESEDESEEQSGSSSAADDIVRASDKIEDEYLKQAQKAAKAKALKEKFEKWEPEKQSNNSAVHMLDSEQSSTDTTKSLRARFESLRAEQPAEKNRPKVNRFVESSLSVFCDTCYKKVYPLEKVEAGGKTFHKNCFKCTRCSCILRMETFTMNNGHLYCVAHFKQLFITKGNYDEGFGNSQHKKKWPLTPPSVPEPIANGSY